MDAESETQQPALDRTLTPPKVKIWRQKYRQRLMRSSGHQSHFVCRFRTRRYAGVQPGIRHRKAGPVHDGRQQPRGRFTGCK